MPRPRKPRFYRVGEKIVQSDRTYVVQPNGEWRRDA